LIIDLTASDPEVVKLEYGRLKRLFASVLQSMTAVLPKFAEILISHTSDLITGGNCLADSQTD
jgi:hypothetical protein